MDKPLNDAVVYPWLQWNASEPKTYDLKKLLERDPNWSPFTIEIEIPAPRIDRQADILTPEGLD